MSAVSESPCSCPKSEDGRVVPVGGGLASSPCLRAIFLRALHPRLSQVRYARGVLRIVSSGRMALPVEDAVIEAIEARTDTEGLVEIGPPPLRAGNRVRIEAGPLEGLFGVLERESDDRTRVTILLETLHTARVVIDSDCLAKAD